MPDLGDVERALRARRRDLDQAVGEARAVGARGQAVAAEVAELSAQVATLEKVAIVLNSIGETRQADAQAKVESLVTLGLQRIFGESLSFHLVTEQKRGGTTVDFMVRTALADGSVIETPVMEARGGGVAATVGFLLRLVVLLLKRPQESVIFLDETFAHVSDGYIERVSEFLSEITERTGVQIIMVTHQAALTEHADVVYRFSLDARGRTRVEERA